VQQLLGAGASSLSLLGRFVSGQIWNEDHLALEVLFQRQPRLRPAGFERASGQQRLQLLRQLAVRHQRELALIRERIVRPIFGNPANFQVAPVGTCQIRDLRADVRRLGPLPGGKTRDGRVWYKRDARASPRKQAAIDSVVLHHTAYNIGNDLNSYLKVGAHYVVTADGQIGQLYDDLDFVNASHGFNPRSIGIEVIGNFSDHRYHWWKARESSIPDRCYLAPAQIRAGRCLVATLKSRHPGIKYLYAHRQSSSDREGDPGPDVWFNIGEWALANLKLTDRLPRTHIGDGKPIPDVWRTRRPALSAPGPSQPAGSREIGVAQGGTGGNTAELEAIEAISLGVAIFSEGRAIITSGALSSTANTVNYIHEKTPPTQVFTRTSMELKVLAHHPRIGIGTQEFWFRVSFEHNGNDLRNAQIILLEDKSSRMITSTFSIQFNGQPYSVPSDPVAEIVFQIAGRWDPVGLGVDSFWGEMFIKADGGARASIRSEQGWVRVDGFHNVQRVRLGPATPPRPAPPTPPSGRPTLRAGSKGPAVSDLQTRLNRWLQGRGMALLTVDGDFGPRTHAAVLAFQRANDLAVDGVVGPMTWGQLLAL
jgi:hypothetical protein